MITVRSPTVQRFKDTPFDLENKEVRLRSLNDLAALGRAAAARGKRVPTLTLETDARFATPADQRRFAEDLTTALTTLAAKYHHPDAPQGRTFRVFACSYPDVPARPAEPERGREADMEAT